MTTNKTFNTGIGMSRFARMLALGSTLTLACASTRPVEQQVDDSKLDVDATPRTAKSSFEDSWIVVMIDSKMTVDPEVQSRNVDVDVYEGVVTLSGVVKTEAARAEAEDLALSVDGVLKVVNELEIGG